MRGKTAAEARRRELPEPSIHPFLEPDWPPDLDDEDGGPQ